MKKCPICAEEIQDEAIKCRYCGGKLSLKISSITSGSLADKIGFKKNDILLSINGKVTSSIESINNIKQKIELGSPFIVKVVRNEEILSLEGSFSNNKSLGIYFGEEKGKGEKANSSNGAAIASFILGILAVITGIFGVGLLFGVIAVCLGKQGRASKQSALASWGIGLGYFAIFCAIAVILFWFFLYGGMAYLGLKG